MRKTLSNSNKAAWLFCVFFLALPAHANRHRSHAAIAEFKRQHPCPATGQHRGACKGYIIDHRQALCVGGEDKPENMRWMTVATAKAKDRWECKPGWQDRLAECEANGCFVKFDKSKE